MERWGRLKYHSAFDVNSVSRLLYTCIPTCLLYTCMPVSLLHTCCMPVWLLYGCIPAVCLLYACCMPAVCLLYACCMPGLMQLLGLQGCGSTKGLYWFSSEHTDHAECVRCVSLITGPSSAELMGAPRDSVVVNKESVPGYVNFDAGDSTTVFIMAAAVLLWKPCLLSCHTIHIQIQSATFSTS